jgi:hypothetical protein
VRQEPKPCRRAVLELKLRPGPIARTFVYITSAKVDLAGGDDVFLDRTARGWRLAAVGCRAQEGKPRSRPLQCEVES